jgi:hypothetical protein
MPDADAMNAARVANRSQFAFSGPVLSSLRTGLCFSFIGLQTRRHQPQLTPLLV